MTTNFTTIRDLAAHVRELLGEHVTDERVRETFHGLKLASHRYEDVTESTVDMIVDALSGAVEPEPITDDQIKALRAEAAAAGDDLQVAICEIAMASGLRDDVPSSAQEHVSELERLGIYAWSIQGSDQARAECERVIRAAQEGGAS